MMFVRFLTREWDDEEQDQPSHPRLLILSAGFRSDIFEVESERKLLTAGIVSLVLALLCGLWFSRVEILELPPDIFERFFHSRRAVTVIPERIPHPERPKPITGPRVLPSRRPGTLVRNRPRMQGGDVRGKVSQQGILAILNGGGTSQSAIFSDVLEKDYTRDLDAALRNLNSLRTQGRPGSGKRQGLIDAHFGSGAGAGNGPVGIDGLMNELFGNSPTVDVRRRATVRVELPRTPGQGPKVGDQRSRESIMRAVLQHLPGLRHAYSKRLKMRPGLHGKIQVRFWVTREGLIARCEMVESSLRDPVLEKEILQLIRCWRFEAVEAGGNVMVEYPFLFAS